MGAREGEKRDEKILVTVRGEGSKDDGSDHIRHGDTSLECSAMDADTIATCGEGMWSHAKVDETEKCCMDEGGACAGEEEGEGNENVEYGS